MNKIWSFKSIEVDPRVHPHAHVVISPRHSPKRIVVVVQIVLGIVGVVVVVQIVLGIVGVVVVVLANVKRAVVVAERSDGASQHLVVPEGILHHEMGQVEWRGRPARSIPILDETVRVKTQREL